MDNGTPIILEKLSRGAVLGANSFLVADENRVNAVCATQTQIFTIDRDRFTQIVQKDNELFKKLLNIVKKMLESPASDLTLDFIQVKHTIELPTGEIISGQQAIKACELSQKLKNVIMQLIFKEREIKKVPKLKDILNDAIARQKRE